MSKRRLDRLFSPRTQAPDGACTAVSRREGESTFVHLSFDQVAAGDVRRVQIRPFVLSARERGLPVDPCRVTLEVIDDETGRTVFALQAPAGSAQRRAER